MPRLFQSPFFVLVVRRRTDFYHRSAPYFTDLILGRRCVGGVAALMSNQRALSCVTSFSGNLILSLLVHARGEELRGSKMSLRETVNFGLKKLGLNDIRENQRKVVEAYVCGRDVLMIAPTGSGKSLTFHIAPFALDFFKHSETDIVETVCLVIFPLVSLMKDQVSSLCEKGVKAVVLGSESSDTETKDASEGKYNVAFTSPGTLFTIHRSTILAFKNKIQAVFIDEVYCVAKW